MNGEHEQMLPECQEKFSAYRETQIQIAADINHIKERIDNGMSKTIAQLATDFTALAPVIKHHDDIVRRVEDIGWSVSKWAIVGLVASLIGVLIWAIANGWKP